MKRVQSQYIQKDLTANKMVFLTGPRQVGKTYLAKQIAKQYSRSVYLNYDSEPDRKIMLEQSWLDTTDLLVLDELHKMANWKNYIKGIFDTKPKTMHILVTGSARLEVFNQIGDSLAGRYFLHRLLPFSPAELKQINQPIQLDMLLSKGGFPEPYLANELESQRWRLQYINSMLSTDVFEFDRIQNIKAIRTLFELLRTKIGSPISYQSLAEDIAISPITVKKYIQILEALYIVFTVTPFSKKIARSLLKEPKVYFFDTGLIKSDTGAKLENMVALSLLKHAYAKTDYLAESYNLHYLRTKDGLEVDFALAKDNEIQQIIEIKNSDSDISKALYHFHEKYQFPAIQLVRSLRTERQSNHVKVLKAESFLSEMMFL